MSSGLEVAEATQGQRYPFIPLNKALDRARQLWSNAKDHPVVSTEAVKVWGYSEKASGGVQTVAALRYYGIIQSVGAGHARKLKFTDEGKKYFLDERPEKHAEAHKIFALRPKAMLKLWDLWHTSGPPSEAIARSTLKIDLGYSEKSAREILAIYIENVSFAKLNPSDRVPQGATVEIGSEEPELSVASTPEPGDIGPQGGKGTRMSEVQTAHAGHGQSRAPIQSGMREDTCNLPEGMVILSFPEHFSKESYADLEAWLDFQKNRLKRWVADV